MRNPTRIVLRTGATAASLGAYLLERAADTLNGLAEDKRKRRSSAGPTGTDVPVEHRGEARRLEPVTAGEPPSNPAAPAGGDPEGTSATGPVPRRISNPKAARKVRKRETAAAASVKRLEVKGQAKGARPATALGKAEPTPAELAKSGAGRKPAPMGSDADSGDEAS